MTSCEAIRFIGNRERRLTDTPVCPRLESCVIHCHRFLTNLDDEDMASLCRTSKSIQLDPQQMLFRENEKASRFFVVLSGRMKLVRINGQGRECILGSASEGDVLGEVAACAPEGTYPYDAQCLESAEVQAFSARSLKEMINARSDYVSDALGYMSEAVHRNVNEVEILSRPSAQDRLVRFILQLLPEKAGSATEEIELPLPKGLIASRLAMQPETLSRLLTDLRRKGVLDVDRRRVVVHDRQALEALSL